MEHSFPTSAGKVKVVVHEASRIVSISRLGADGRRDSTMCDWNTSDLKQVLAGMSVPLSEAREIAEQVKAAYPNLAVAPPPLVSTIASTPAPQPAKRLESAGIALRFVAVLLDSIIVFFPLGFVMGLMEGGGNAESADGYGSAGASLGTDVTLFLVFLGICYYVFAEAYTGMTVGKRIVGIRVVDEDGTDIGFGAAVVRNVLRLVDGLFFYLVGAIVASSSPRGQRLGDRAAHTVVVRRT